MKLGLALSAGTGSDPLARLAAQALAVERAGLDVVWLASEDVPSPLLSAAALAARTSSVRIAACVDAGPHPLEIAEAASVADSCSAGRLILAVRAREGERELLAETADVLLKALAPRPFSHAGRRWRIPAALPENDGAERLVAMTPATIQVELPLWLCGAGAAACAGERGLCWVVPEDRDAARAGSAWSAAERTLGLAAARLRRPALRALGVDAAGGFDEDALLARLREEQRDWGLDLAVLRPSAVLGEKAWREMVARVASRVRPGVVQDVLPSGLEQHWRERDEPVGTGGEE